MHADGSARSLTVRASFADIPPAILPEETKTKSSAKPRRASSGVARSSHKAPRRHVGTYNLVFAGQGKFALAYHLGVCIRLSETGMLDKFDVIFAEGLGVLLAALLRCHWRVICSDDPFKSGYQDQSRSYRYLLTAPPATLYETSKEQKEVMGVMKDTAAVAAGATPGSPLSATQTGSVTVESKNTPTTSPISERRSATQQAQVRPAQPVTTVSAPDKPANTKSIFTQKITEPIMDLILNIDTSKPNDKFSQWMTRCSLSLDTFAEDTKQDEFQRRCSLRLFGSCEASKQFSVRQFRPGCFNQREAHMLSVLPAILWDKQCVPKSVARYSSIWHAVLAYGYVMERDMKQHTTFITSLADVPGGQLKRAYQEPVPATLAQAVSPETRNLMQNLLNSHLTTSADCECQTADADKHVHCLRDLLRNEFVQNRSLVIEALAGCPIAGNKISTTVSPDNRLVVSPAQTPTHADSPRLGPQSDSGIAVSALQLPSTNKPASASSTHRPAPGVAAPNLRMAISHRSFSVGATRELRPTKSSGSSSVSLETKTESDKEASGWPHDVHLQIEQALLKQVDQPSLPVSHAVTGSCLNWGYKQAAVYIHKMLKQSPKLSWLNLTQRKFVFPIQLQSSIHMLLRNSQTVPKCLPELPTQRKCSCLCCCSCH